MRVARMCVPCTEYFRRRVVLRNLRKEVSYGGITGSILVVRVYAG